MGYYLLDNPPASPQFHTSRANTPTWAVSVHTSEGPRDAAALAGFIARRPDPGSYATIVDADTTIDMVPPDYTTFSVAASGYNSRTYAVCIAGRSADLSATDVYTLACIDRLGSVVANLWALVGVDPSNAAWVGTAALDGPGLFCHGDVQPWDRTDAWSIHPDRAALDQALVDAIWRHARPNPPPSQETIVRRFIRARSRPEVFCTDLLTKVHMQSEQALREMNYALGQSGLTPLAPPPDAQVEVIAGVAVWVVSDAFAATIPTVK